MTEGDQPAQPDEVEPDPPHADVKFHWGCINGNFSAVQHWYEQGAEISLVSHGYTPLLRCAGAFQDKPEVLEFLLEHGAEDDINTPTIGDGENTALHLAALLGHGEVGTILIDRGAHLNAVNEAGMTPLGMIDMYQHQYDCIVEPRQKEILAGKETIAKLLREKGGLLTPPTEEEKAAAPAAVEAAQAAPAKTVPVEQDPVKTPEPAAAAVTPASANAPPMSPMDRVVRLEEAMNSPSTGGVAARLVSIEENLLGEKQSGTIPNRLLTLEREMGVVEE